MRMRDFGERLRRARIDAGYEHASDFASALGVEAATYRYWERGQSAPHLLTLTRICHLLRLEPNDLLMSQSRRPHDAPRTRACRAA